MPRPLNSAPSYRHHRQSGQAITTVRLVGGARRDFLLGRFGTAASRREHPRITAVVGANGGIYPADAFDITVNEALVLTGKSSSVSTGTRPVGRQDRSGPTAVSFKKDGEGKMTALLMHRAKATHELPRDKPGDSQQPKK